MKTNRLVAIGFIAGSFSVFGNVLINESFSGANMPSGWIFNGKEGASNTSITTGVDKVASDWIVKENGTNFLRLTENASYQRTTAIYTNTTFRTDRNFSLRADIRITCPGNGADGLSFFWLKANTVSNLSATIGGVGSWMGVPRGSVNGKDNNLGQAGYYLGLKGYSFEFDHYKNSTNEISDEYNDLVRLEDWMHFSNASIDQSANTNFFEDCGWQTFQFAYNASNDNFTVSWGFNGSTFSSNVTYSVSGYEKFDSAYFGIGAGTGGWYSSQDVRNLTLTGMVVPEPATAALIAFVGGLSLFIRRRFME